MSMVTTRYLAERFRPYRNPGCGSEDVGDMTRPGDRRVRTIEGGPHDPFLRVREVFEVTRAYPDGSIDVRCTYHVTPRAYVDHFDVTLGFQQP